MVRLFKRHNIRRQEELDGLWEFCKSDNPEIIPGLKFDYALPVPSCWEMHPDLVNYRGTGIYRKKINIEKDSRLRLEFKGVSHTAFVYFDNILLGSHYNAFTPFSFITEKVTKGQHEIIVVADNSFSEKSSLHKPNDYNTYGGIIRPVTLEYIPDTHIDRIEFLPFNENGTWRAEVSVFVANKSQKSVNAKISVEICGVKKNAEIIIGAGAHGKGCLNFEPENVLPWSPENPSLYFLNASLYLEDNLTDDLIERVGFREVKIESSKILLNGKQIFIKGFNRHEDHSFFGAAIPFAAMVNDLELMAHMNSNAVRTCHYPNDELFLDLCDEKGFLVWEENHARGLDLASMQNPKFIEQCAACNEEMVTAHFNHPSIVIWGLLNECDTTTMDGRAHYQRQIEQIKSLDKTRPVTFATCYPFKDICLDLADIVSFNLYSGWYTNTKTPKYIDDIIKWSDTAGGAGKPVIISEFGASAIYGMHEFSRAKWSEERQSDIIEENITAYRARDEVCGLFIWQFCDVKISKEGHFVFSRPGERNNKGVVDTFRRPKLAFYTVKRLYGETV